jgi:hypothetical protein
MPVNPEAPEHMGTKRTRSWLEKVNSYSRAPVNPLHQESPQKVSLLQMLLQKDLRAPGEKVVVGGWLRKNFLLQSCALGVGKE